MLKIPCESVKTIVLTSGATVHSVSIRVLGGGIKRITISDGTLVDLDCSKAELIHYNAEGRLIKIHDHKNNSIQFWVKNL